jgi:hypothetical protein
MWRAVYLSKMPGIAQRSRIVIDWLLSVMSTPAASRSKV